MCNQPHTFEISRYIHHNQVDADKGKSHIVKYGFSATVISLLMAIIIFIRQKSFLHLEWDSGALQVRLSMTCTASGDTGTADISKGLVFDDYGNPIVSFIKVFLVIRCICF